MTDRPSQRNAALLSYGLELAGSFSPQFKDHVLDLVRQAVNGEISAADFVSDQFRSSIDLFKSESPTNLQAALPPDLDSIEIDPACVDLVFSEILHRVTWDITMAKNSHTAEFLVQLVSQTGRGVSK